MDITFDLPIENNSLIKVIGVGGGGSNAVNHMYKTGVVGVSFLVCNTDEQHLKMSPIPNKLLLGPELTKGLGTGADPEVGKKATEESMMSIKEKLGNGTQMVFVTAGMGKGTGTGGSPIIAKMAKDMGILTIGIVTSPFSNLGPSTVRKAEEGIALLRENVDALIIVSNDKLKEIYGNMRLGEAFALADDVLTTAAKGISEIITSPGVINTDFMDVRNVLKNGGLTIMGNGKASGEGRQISASKKALESPLLKDCDIRGAKKALVNIAYSEEFEIELNDIDDILREVRQASANDIDLIYGTSVDNSLGEDISVTVVVTDYENSVESRVSPKIEEPIIQEKPMELINLAPVQSSKIEMNNDQEITISLDNDIDEPSSLSLFDNNYNESESYQTMNSEFEPQIAVSNDLGVEETSNVQEDLHIQLFEKEEDSSSTNFVSDNNRSSVLKNLSFDLDGDDLVKTMDFKLTPLQHKNLSVKANSDDSLFKGTNYLTPVD